MEAEASAFGLSRLAYSDMPPPLGGGGGADIFVLEWLQGNGLLGLRQFRGIKEAMCGR